MLYSVGSIVLYYTIIEYFISPVIRMVTASHLPTCYSFIISLDDSFRHFGIKGRNTIGIIRVV